MDYYESGSTNGEIYDLLKRSIEEILSFIKPLESDRERRLNTINELTLSIQSNPNLNGVTVQPFGSFVSNLYSKWGDLDISINLNYEFSSNANKKKKNSVLKEIRKMLQKRGIARKIEFIPQARVPLLNYESNLFGISCDLSVENHQGCIKSKIVRIMTSLDERFTDMVLLIKEWAKAQKINNPKCGTLNSYSLCLLVIFHLQTCEPAILPPMKEIYDGNISDEVEGMEFRSEKQIEDVCASNVQKIISNISSHKNQSSLFELLVSFFDKFSEIEAIASEYAICPFTGRWEEITKNPNWTKKSHILYIEDPFEQPDNSARSVYTNGLKAISDAFKLTCQTLSPSSRSLSDRNSLLYLLSRPLVSSKLGAPIKLSAPKKNSYNNNNTNYYYNDNYYQQPNHYYVDNRIHQESNNAQYGGNLNQPVMTSQNRARNHQVRLNRVVGQPTQLTQFTNANNNNNNINRAVYSHTNQSYGTNYNFDGGINGIASRIGPTDLFSNVSQNRARLNRSGSSQTHRGADPNFNYNGGGNGIVHTSGFAELASNGPQNRARLNGGSSSSQTHRGVSQNYDFNGGRNGIVQAASVHELVSNGSQNRGRMNGGSSFAYLVNGGSSSPSSSSYQARPSWKPKDRTDQFNLSMN